VFFCFYYYIWEIFVWSQRYEVALAPEFGNSVGVDDSMVIFLFLHVNKISVPEEACYHTAQFCSHSGGNVCWSSDFALLIWFCLVNIMARM
jgi:hypothetical protein